MAEIDEVKQLIRDTEKEIALGANPYWFGTRLNTYRNMLEYLENQEDEMMMQKQIELENGVKLQLETNKVISGSWDKREITVQLRITPTPKELGKFTCVVISDNSVMIQVNKVVKS